MQKSTNSNFATIIKVHSFTKTPENCALIWIQLSKTSMFRKAKALRRVYILTSRRSSLLETSEFYLYFSRSWIPIHPWPVSSDNVVDTFHSYFIVTWPGRTKRRRSNTWPQLILSKYYIVHYRLYSKSSLTVKEWRLNLSFPWVSVQFLNSWRVSVVPYCVTILTLVLFKNSIDTQGKLNLNFHQLSVSELLEYRRKSSS